MSNAIHAPDFAKRLAAALLELRESEASADRAYAEFGHRATSVTERELHRAVDRRNAAQKEWERLDAMTTTSGQLNGELKTNTNGHVQPTGTLDALLAGPPGLHHNVHPSTYLERRLGVVSKGALDLIHRSPAHYKAWIDGAAEEVETAALTFGRGFHCALLEPERFAREFTYAPDFGDCRKTDNRRRRDEWREEHAGSEVISADEYTAIAGMVASVRAHPLAGKMILDGEPELTVTWKDADTGLSCKCRADYYVPKLAMVADVKSTEDASAEKFRRDVVKYRYLVQDALYRDGFAAVGAAVQYFVFIAVEKRPPYAVAVYTLDADGIGRGYTSARRDIDRLAECIETNTWPAYPANIQTLELPPWSD